MEELSILGKNKTNSINTFFTDVTNSNKIDFYHKENNFDDFEKQILLPHKMSQFGPALAISDINNDGLDDVYVGGAVGFSGERFIQNIEGNFTKSITQTFELDKMKEDIDALFFDVDGDNDNDLYVVSGGNEYENENYKDRLYLNDGEGNFISDISFISNCISGGVVIAEDMDADGDLDLFVGGRQKPHEYPMPVDSKLFENVNGKLVDVTKEKGAELLGLGMVTSAIWSDNDFDLIIVGEWMNITIFKNENGFLKKEKIESLEDSSGWWFSIEQGDFDNDGDMDYIAGNLGLNYKYKATKETPFDVYYEDFDGNGSEDIVLGYYNFGKHYPLRGFSCSSQQVPKLKEEFKKNDIFASLELNQVYGEKKLKKSAIL